MSTTLAKKTDVPWPGLTVTTWNDGCRGRLELLGLDNDGRPVYLAFVTDGLGLGVPAEAIARITTAPKAEAQP